MTAGPWRARDLRTIWTPSRSNPHCSMIGFSAVIVMSVPLGLRRIRQDPMGTPSTMWKLPGLPSLEQSTHPTRPLLDALGCWADAVFVSRSCFPSSVVIATFPTGSPFQPGTGRMSTRVICGTPSASSEVASTTSAGRVREAVLTGNGSRGIGSSRYREQLWWSCRWHSRMCTCWRSRYSSCRTGRGCCNHSGSGSSWHSGIGSS